MFKNNIKVQCVLWFTETKSLVSVQHKFRIESRRKAPHVNKQQLLVRTVQRNKECLWEKVSGRPAVTEAWILLFLFFLQGVHQEHCVHQKK